MPDSPEKSAKTSPRRKPLDAHLDALKSRRIAPSDAGSIRRAYVGEPAPVATPAIAEAAPVASAPPAIEQPATPATVATPAIVATVRQVAGYTPVPHVILDSLAEALPPSEFVVYLRLYRLSHGHKRETCRVGHGKLAKGCHLSRRTVQTVVDRLAALGLVERLPDPNPRAASEYRVIVPGAAIAKSAIATPAIAPTAASKDRKEKHETAPLAPDRFEIRESAARLKHAYPYDTHEERIARVLSAFAAQGRAVTRVSVDEALAGLAL